MVEITNNLRMEAAREVQFAPLERVRQSSVIVPEASSVSSAEKR